MTITSEARGVAYRVATLIRLIHDPAGNGADVRAEDRLAGALADLVLLCRQLPSGDAPPQTDEFVGSDAWDRLDHESKSPNDEVEVLSADVSELLSAVLWYRAKGGDAPQEPSGDTYDAASDAESFRLANARAEASRPPGAAEPPECLRGRTTDELAALPRLSAADVDAALAAGRDERRREEGLAPPGSSALDKMRERYHEAERRVSEARSVTTEGVSWIWSDDDTAASVDTLGDRMVVRITGGHLRVIIDERGKAAGQALREAVDALADEIDETGLGLTDQDIVNKLRALASEGAAPPQPNPLTGALTMAVKELNSHHRDTSHRTPAYMIAQAEAALAAARRPPVGNTVTETVTSITTAFDPVACVNAEAAKHREERSGCMEPSGVPDAPGEVDPKSIEAAAAEVVHQWDLHKVLGYGVDKARSLVASNLRSKLRCTPDADAGTWEREYKRTEQEHAELMDALGFLDEDHADYMKPTLDRARAFAGLRGEILDITPHVEALRDALSERRRHALMHEAAKFICAHLRAALEVQP